MGLLSPRISKTFILLCCLFAISEAQKLKTSTISFGKFDTTDLDVNDAENGALHSEGNSTIHNDALQLTLDTLSAQFIRTMSGRILLKKRFKLWEGGNDTIASNTTTTRVASFNTSFLVNFHKVENATAAEGLTFFISPGLDLIPTASYGQFLGLTNATTDGHPSNQIVAVELDTFKQEFDPDDNHIGLNINRVNSTESVPLEPHNITLATPEDRFHNVWVEYDGVEKVIRVYIARQETQTGPTPPRPDSTVIERELDLREVLNQYSYFGFSGSTGRENVELNCVLRWNLTVEHYEDGDHPWEKILLGAGVPAVVLILLGAAGVGYYFYRKKMGRSNPNILGALRSLPGSPREFKFRELKKATNNFDEKRKLGQGGYGVVYRGFLANDNLDIAVKWFLRESIKGQDDFLAELTIINRLRHKHLVRLLGWCHRNGKLLLVYEYMPKGSLDQHLFAGKQNPPLNWNLRYKIVSGVSSALHYLHNEYDERVVHRDLKASNIMLDDNFNARLGDFGLARVLENEKTSYAEAEGMPGTHGYIAPECFHTEKATQQSDVYAFGAVLLEVVCGQRPVTKVANFSTLVDWVWFLHRDGLLLQAVDERLGEDYDAVQAERLLLLALACSHPIACERPKTQAILQIISGSVPAPYVPPFKPAFVWPASLPSMLLPLSIDSSTANTSSNTTSHFNSGWSQQYMSRESCAEYTDKSIV